MELREMNDEFDCGYDNSYVTCVSEFRWCGKKFIIPRANHEDTSLGMQFKRRNEIVNDICIMDGKTWKEKNSNQNILSSGKEYLLPDGRRDCTDLNDKKKSSQQHSCTLFSCQTHPRRKEQSFDQNWWSESETEMDAFPWHRNIHGCWYILIIGREDRYDARESLKTNTNESSVFFSYGRWKLFALSDTKLMTVANGDFRSVVTRVDILISHPEIITVANMFFQSLRSDHVPRMSPRICHGWNDK